MEYSAEEKLKFLLRINENNANRKKINDNRNRKYHMTNRLGPDPSSLPEIPKEWISRNNIEYKEQKTPIIPKNDFLTCDAIESQLTKRKEKIEYNWCLHPDCLESTHYFKSDLEVFEHSMEYHKYSELFLMSFKLDSGEYLYFIGGI